ncbi:hypothetical protein M433DRAFT_34935, partial [Acidomyces richmondensis BFW]
RAYKDFLTPLLHRRFTSAALIALLACWLTSTFIAVGTGAGLFWSWFPIFSLTGLRTLLLFIPCLAVFIVRVMNMHIGQRVTTCAANTVLQLLIGPDRALPRTLGTLFWYIFGAWFYSEVYVWSKGARGYLSWIDPGREYERARVNENPFFLRALLLFVAVVQAVRHLLEDTDRLPVEEKMGKEEDGQHHWVASLAKLGRLMQPMVLRAVPTTLMCMVYFIPLYFGFVRPVFWPYVSAIARAMHRNLLPDRRPPGFIHPTKLGWQSLTSALMLVMLFSISNAVFTIYVTQPPIKRGHPLTSEIKDPRGTIISKSNDPNGSLIRGLNAKREIPSAFAFWELYLICTTKTFQSRRKTIFSEVDRKHESTWTQISSHCLREISAVSQRITAAKEPNVNQKMNTECETQSEQPVHLTAQSTQPSLGLPKIADRKVLDDHDIYLKNSGKQSSLRAVSTVARSLGQDPSGAKAVTSRAQRVFAHATAGSREAFTREGLDAGMRGKIVEFLRLPLGAPFRQTFSRRANAIVFGSPYSRQATLIHAVRALVALTVASLQEDDFGQVAPDVPQIIRVLTSTVTDVRNFVEEGLEPSWTDVCFTPEHRKVREVEETLDVLRGGLEEVVLGFGEYAANLGLTKKELREAREAVGNR